jgi:hypothetical protein
MNKWELAHYHVSDLLDAWLPGQREDNHRLASALVQKLVDEGIIQSTVENDLRGDVS